MWKSLTRCAVIGGIVVYLWLTLEWAVLPFHRQMLNHFAESSEVVSAITKYAPYDGVYVYPKCEESTGKQPFIFINVKRDVDCKAMTVPMVRGVIMQMVGAFIITYLLMQTKISQYWNRVWFVTLVGLAIAVLGILPAWNWWYFPPGWVALEVFDMIVGWFLGGLVIAKLVKN